MNCDSHTAGSTLKEAASQNIIMPDATMDKHTVNNPSQDFQYNDAIVWKNKISKLNDTLGEKK